MPDKSHSQSSGINAQPTAFAPAFNYDAAPRFRLPQWSGDGSSPITHLNSITLATNRQPENKKPLGVEPNDFYWIVCRSGIYARQIPFAKFGHKCPAYRSTPKSQPQSTNPFSGCLIPKQHPIRPPNQQQNRHAQRGGKQEKTRVINLLHNRARIAADGFGQQRHQR